MTEFKIYWMQVARQLHLYRGVMPIHYTADKELKWTDDIDNRINFAIKMGFERSIIRVSTLFS